MWYITYGLEKEDKFNFKKNKPKLFFFLVYVAVSAVWSDVSKSTYPSKRCKSSPAKMVYREDSSQVKKLVYCGDTCKLAKRIFLMNPKVFYWLNYTAGLITQLRFRPQKFRPARI